MIDADILNLELYRFNLDADMSMAGCMDPMEMFRVVSAWLRGVAMSQVSRLAALRYFDIDTLDLGLYRCDLDPTASPSPSNDSVQRFWIICGWLHCSGAFLVSCFDFSALADFYRFEFDSATSTVTPDESIQMLCVVDGWLCRSGAFLVSRFRSFELADFYRLDLESSASTVMRNESVRTVCMVGRWHR